MKKRDRWDRILLGLNRFLLMQPQCLIGMSLREPRNHFGGSFYNVGVDHFEKSSFKAQGQHAWSILPSLRAVLSDFRDAFQAELALDDQRTLSLQLPRKRGRALGCSRMAHYACSIRPWAWLPPSGGLGSSVKLACFKGCYEASFSLLQPAFPDRRRRLFGAWTLVCPGFFVPYSQWQFRAIARLKWGEPLLFQAVFLGHFQKGRDDFYRVRSLDFGMLGVGTSITPERPSTSDFREGSTSFLRAPPLNQGALDEGAEPFLNLLGTDLACFKARLGRRELSLRMLSELLQIFKGEGENLYAPNDFIGNFFRRSTSTDFSQLLPQLPGDFMGALNAEDFESLEGLLANQPLKVPAFNKASGFIKELLSQVESCRNSSYQQQCLRRLGDFHIVYEEAQTGLSCFHWMAIYSWYLSFFGQEAEYKAHLARCSTQIGELTPQLTLNLLEKTATAASVGDIFTLPHAIDAMIQLGPEGIVKILARTNHTACVDPNSFLEFLRARRLFLQLWGLRGAHPTVEVQRSLDDQGYLDVLKRAYSTVGSKTPYQLALWLGDYPFAETLVKKVEETIQASQLPQSALMRFYEAQRSSKTGKNLLEWLVARLEWCAQRGLTKRGARALQFAVRTVVGLHPELFFEMLNEKREGEEYTPYQAALMSGQFGLAAVLLEKVQSYSDDPFFAGSVQIFYKEQGKKSFGGNLLHFLSEPLHLLSRFGSKEQHDRFLAFSAWVIDTIDSKVFLELMSARNYAPLGRNTPYQWALTLERFPLGKLLLTRTVQMTGVHSSTPLRDFLRNQGNFNLGGNLLHWMAIPLRVRLNVSEEGYEGLLDGFLKLIKEFSVLNPRLFLDLMQEKDSSPRRRTPDRWAIAFGIPRYHHALQTLEEESRHRATMLGKVLFTLSSLNGVNACLDAFKIDCLAWFEGEEALQASIFSELLNTPNALNTANNLNALKLLDRLKSLVTSNNSDLLNLFDAHPLEVGYSLINSSSAEALEVLKRLNVSEIKELRRRLNYLNLLASFEAIKLSGCSRCLNSLHYRNLMNALEALRDTDLPHLKIGQDRNGRKASG